MNFTELELNGDLQKGITEAGYETCTPVQAQVLSGAMEGVDLYVQSQTGTGKTAAYLITIFQQILTNPAMKGKKALVMVPTRELAVQVEEEARTLGKYTGLVCASFYGGVGYARQQELLTKGVDILIGTPGRVIDLEESKTMKLDNVGFLVIDEADRMFDMGFYPDLRTLIKVLPGTKERQTMLFSATLNTYVKNLAWEYTEEAKEITIECENITVSEIDQTLLHVSSSDKMKLLIGILTNEKPESVIVFCNTKRMSEITAKRLQLNGFESEFIIGDLPQSKRLQVIDSFKRGSLKCLVATDVAARGIDVNDLSMVVNFDLPNEAENYVHRIGRTARAGKTGKAYTFCSEQDVYNLPAIERYVEMNIPSAVADESMFGEDKSAGTYIKTGTYYEEGGDRDHSYGHDRGGRRDARNDRPSRDRSPRGERGKRPTGARTDVAPRDDARSENGRNRPARGRQDNRRKPEGTSQRRNNAPYAENQQEQDQLATLSFDERMKVYKQKYAQTSSASQGGRKGADNRNKPNGKDASRQRRNGGKPYNQAKGAKQTSGYKKSTQAARSAQISAAAPTSVQKQGIFSKIKSLFSKKK